MRTSTGRIVGGTMAIVMSAALLSASNLVTNGDFNTGTAGWAHFTNVSFEWDPTSDYANQPDSGSAVVIADLPTYVNSGATQCIDGIVGGQPYDLSVWVRMPTGQSGSGSAKVFVWWYTQPGCVAGGPLTGPLIGEVYPTDVWVERVAPRVNAPSDAASALVYLNVAKQTAGGELQAFFDHVVLTSDAIFSDGFESGGTGAWSGQIGE